jgi:hypothetical protein
MLQVGGRTHQAIMAASAAAAQLHAQYCWPALRELAAQQ